MHKQQPTSLTVLAVTFFLFGVLAFIGSFFLWGQGMILSFPEDIDLGLPAADILVNAPASILCAVGLWQRRRWGVYMLWFCAGFYLYASVEIFAHYAQLGELYKMEIVLPQTAAVLVGAAGMIIGWKKRDLFNN